MPRRSRCIVPGIACHITQRGVNRRDTFSTDEDRLTYLRLLKENRSEAGVSLLGYCLMTNHVHLVAVPEREDSLSILFRRVHGRYAQYYNARWGRTGHLWQNRFFACSLDEGHLRSALLYVERNPVRAGMVPRAAQYRWSSAAAHQTGSDETGLLDMEWWKSEPRSNWEQALHTAETEDAAADIRKCTYSGRPFGSEDFVSKMAEKFGRYWTRGRPRKVPARSTQALDQFALFANEK